MNQWACGMKCMLLGLIFALVLLTVPPVSVSGAESIAVLIDGKNLNMDVPPYNEGSTLMLPVRALFEGLNAQVEMLGTGLIVGKKGETEVTMSIGSTKATINGQEVALTVPVKPVGERTLAPVRFVAESLNCYASWDQANQAALILSGEKDWEGYPNTPDAVVAAIILARGLDNVDLKKYTSDNPSWDSWTPVPAVYSNLRIKSIEERGPEYAFDYSSAQDIAQQTGLPCKAFVAVYEFKLSDYALTHNYIESEGDATNWFYLVQESDGKWKVESGFNTGP